MAPSLPYPGSSSALVWRPTKIMNMRDLSNDDDFLSHLLVEKLGTGAVPLYVHKMDPGRRLPKTDSADLLNIVRRLVLSKASLQNAIRQAVDDLLLLPALRYYLKSYTQKQINAFSTHASRYLELYHPSGSIEIAHTSRYAHKTGKSELCILATRNLAPGTVITELKGSMANLTDEEDRDLKRAGIRSGDIRRDFSVIHSKSMKKNHLFLGPARFVNHDCNNNCELFREGRYITFRVLRPINIGDEITAHYGDCYFGRQNRHCLCETCEKNGRGGYAPEQDDENNEPSDSSSNSDSESDTEIPAPEPETLAPVNVNERRTRRGVYAIVTREEDSDESENEEDDKVPLADAKDIPADGEIELTTEVDTASELTSLTPSIPPPDNASNSRDPVTPAPEQHHPLARFSSSLSSLSSAGDASPRSNSSTPFRSIISTRRQKAQQVEEKQKPAPRESNTPGTPSQRLTRSASALLSVDASIAKSVTPSETPKRGRPSIAGNESVQVKKEEVEPRVLRTRPPARPPAPPPPEPRKAPPKPDTPRGADGKILPTCATCNSILPLISVDSKVVWGLGFENGKKRKKHDCPRCLRHFAIYNHPWPRRLPPHGAAFSVTPREESTPLDSNKRVTQKSLPVLDRKLAAAVSAGKRPRKEDISREEEPASKRRKTEPVVVKVKQAAASNKAHPSASTSEYASANKKTSSERHHHQTDPTPEPGKRKRGRPRLSDKLINTATPPSSVVKVEETPTLIPSSSISSCSSNSSSSKTSFSQPRNTNGRFGRKDTLLKAQQRAARAATGSSPPSLRKDRYERLRPTRFSPRKKRDSNEFMYADHSPTRKQKHSQDLSADDKNQDDDDDELPLPIHKVLPRRLSTFKGASLVSKPNPLRFATKVWANPVLGDEEDDCDSDDEHERAIASLSSSEEDDQGPETPEDHLSPPDATIVDLEQDEAMRGDDGHHPHGVTSPSTVATMSVSVSGGVGVGAGGGIMCAGGVDAALRPRAPLTYKPSPHTFAKRRWGSIGNGAPSSEAAMDVDLKEKKRGSDRVVRRVQSIHGPEFGFAAADEVNKINDLNKSAPASPAMSDSYPPSQSEVDDDEAAVAAAITVPEDEEDEDMDMELIHLYPVVPKPPLQHLQHQHHGFSQHKSMMPFCSHAYSSTTKPTFIKPGWGDTYSDTSDS